MARLVDLGGVFDTYNDAMPDATRDLVAIGHDWVVVGHGLRMSMDEYVRQYREALSDAEGRVIASAPRSADPA